MTLHTAIKSLSVVAALALAGCLGANPEESPRASKAETLKFINTSATPLAKSAAPIPNEDEIVAELEKIGCPKLAELFKDITDPANAGKMPQSFVDYLSCLGLSPTPTQQELQDMGKKFENPQELLNCICGGSGLANMFSNVKWTEFKASTSDAAGASFKSTTGSGEFKASTNVGGEFKPTVDAMP